MTRKNLAILIEAYADAKASKNQYLVNSMVAQLEQILDSLGLDEEPQPEAVTTEF